MHLLEAEQAALSNCTPTPQPKALLGTALLLYQALRETAVRTGAARGYVSSTTHVTLHIPLEVVALSLGRHRVTVWRQLPKLRALGLIDARPHKCSSELGRAVNDGTLWCVRLNPDEGAPARLSYDDLKHDGWRDLDRDRRRGRTAHQAVRERREKQVQQSRDFPQEGFDLELLLDWSLPPGTQQNPVTNDRCTGGHRDLEVVLDVQYADKADRNEAVDGAAQALAAGLRDQASVAFYRLLIWQLLRVSDRGRGDHFYQVYEQARRAHVDAAEGFARKPGALFVSRLKGAPWWDETHRCPQIRVGRVPRAVAA